MNDPYKLSPDCPSFGAGPGRFRKVGPFCVFDIDDPWLKARGPLGTGAAPPITFQGNSSRARGFDASTLTMSPKAVALLQLIEGLRLAPYDDQISKVTSNWIPGATIGYGHLITKDKWAIYKNGITKEQADALFSADTQPVERAVSKAITVGVQQYQYDAMVLFAFNTGVPGNFRHTSVARLVNNPKAVTAYKSLESAWKAWHFSQGKVNKGLINRRAAEWRIYTSGIYARW